MATNKHEIVLYGVAKTDKDTPSASGFVQKLETFLRAAEFKNYTHEATMPNRAPKKKVPYIVLKTTTPEGQTTETPIPDSHFIIRHLVSNDICPDLDAPLSRSERADSRAWMAYTEDQMYPALVSTRWNHDRPENYAATYDSIPIPGLIKPLILWNLRRNITSIMWTVGMGRHSTEEVNSFLIDWVDNLDAKLEGKEWFFGKDKPTLVDIDNCGFLLNGIGCGQGNSEFLGYLKAKPGLLAWIEKCTKLWFPEYKVVLDFVQSCRVLV